MGACEDIKPTAPAVELEVSNARVLLADGLIVMLAMAADEALAPVFVGRFIACTAHALYAPVG